MEERMQFHKVLHLLIEQFVTEFERYVELKEVDKDKVYMEVLKRSSSIAQEILTVASTFLTSCETAAVPISEEAIRKKISYLVETSLQQDLIECALIAEDVTRNVNISKDDLYNMLYKHSVNGKFAVVPSSMHLLPGCSSEKENISISYFQTHFPTTFATDVPKDAGLLLSNEFENTCNKFEKELLQLKHSLGMGFSSVDLKFTDVSFATGDNYVNHSQASKSLDENLASAHIEDWLHSVMQSKYDCSSMNDISLSLPVKDSFLSWESSVRQSVPCHLYTSELTGKEVLLNVIDEDPHMFRCIHDPSGVVSEYDFVHDVLDLLVGIPSNTFLYNKIQKNFQLKSHSRLFNLSHESTLKFSESFMEAGSLFHKLESFCTECIQSAEGLVLKGLKNGIKEILSVYMEYIATVKMNNPTMLMLRKDISENAALLSTLGVVCGLSGNGNDMNSLPKGLGFLSFLNKLSWSYKSKGNSIIVAVLLKFAYSPYFEFLNKWMTAGICCDPYNEFHIIEDVRHLDRKDELYWKFAYTNIEDDNSRTIPSELEKYAQDILQCGKSMRLLQNCCPQLYSLEYMCCNPLPCFSMVFSYHAVNVKRDECASYILQKETSELEHKSSEAVMSEDDFLIQKQLTVDRKVILRQIQRRCNQSNKIPIFLKESASTIPNWNKDEITTRCKSFPGLTILPDATSFSEIVHKTSGLLFGCSIGEDKKEYKKGSMLHSGKFSRQLNLKSYYHSTAYSPEECQRFKKCVPNSILKPEPDNDHANMPSPDNILEEDFNFNAHAYYVKETIIPVLVPEYHQNNTFFSVDFLNSKIYYERNRLVLVLRRGTPSVDMTLNAAEYTPFSTLLGQVSLRHGSHTCNLPLGSFINSLASLLLSDYRDTKDDISTCLQLTSLQNLMQYNFSAVMNMRMHLIQKTIVDYIINELQLKKLLSCLKNTYFLQDECFSQSLGKRLFNWAMKCDSLDEFADWSILNEMLTRSVAVPSFINVSFLETASVNFVTMPEEYISKRNKFMQYFNFEFKIDWPLNIIIHRDCITHYSRIFSFILEMEFLCWLLAKIWRLLLISAKENQLENSPQYRKLMLDRFDMHQFIRVLRNCIHQDLGGPLWECLEKTLRIEEISIDALQDIHKQYLERALARCFLTEETVHLHDVLEFLFQQVEKFCRAALDCSWKLNPDTSHFESSEFETLYDSYSKYQKLKETFYERILKMVRRKKFQRLYDEHYQLYLETILETGKNM